MPAQATRLRRRLPLPSSIARAAPDRSGRSGEANAELLQRGSCRLPRRTIVSHHAIFRLLFSAITLCQASAIGPSRTDYAIKAAEQRSSSLLLPSRSQDPRARVAVAGLGATISRSKAKARSLGLEIARGTASCVRTEASRAFSKRYFERVGKMPNMSQAGVYSSTRHNLERPSDPL